MGDAAADVVMGGPRGRRARPISARCTARSTRLSSSRTRASPGRSSTRRRWPNWCTRSASSASCSRSWSAHSTARPPVQRYQLVMGERRWRAAQEAGLAAIPAIVRETADDNLLRDALLENIHRAQLNPLEEAAAYQQLLDEFGVTHDELAARIGRSPSADHQHDPTAAAADRGAASGGGRRAVGRPRPGAAVARGRPGRAGGAGGADRRRGPVGPGDRGGGHPGQPRRAEPADARRGASRSRCRACRTLPSGCPSAFDTRVTVSLGKRKGKIVVEFGRSTICSASSN